MPANSARYDVVKRNATIPDTLSMIVKTVNICKASPFVIAETKKLKPEGNKYEFIKRVFDYVCKNVPYILDQPGDEEIWTPELTIREGKGDCKKMSTLIASILDCAGIDPVLKHVYYNNSHNTHIYVIVPWKDDPKGYLVVDPVNYKQWNSEVPDIKSSSLHFLNGSKMDLHVMGSPGHRKNLQHHDRHLRPGFHHKQLQHLSHCIKGIDDDIAETAGNGYMSGLGFVSNEKDKVLANALMGDYGITGLDVEEEIISGIGKRHHRTKAEKHARRKAFKEKLDNARKKVFHVFKKVNLAPSRAAFGLLVRLNVFKLANRMAKAWIHNPEALKKMWKNFGGNPNHLKDIIKKGAKKKPELVTQIHGVSGIGSMGSPPSVDQLEAMETNGTMGYIEGIGSAAAIAAAIAAATPIVLAVVKIVGKSKDDQDSTADDVAEGVQASAEAVADNESTEGIGYMSAEDDIVSGPGEDYDYVDGMGRKRKKNKKKKGKKVKRTKEQKKKDRAAKKAAKKGKSAPDEEDHAEAAEEVEREEGAKSKSRISNDDIKTLSTLAEYGARKILKGQVSPEIMNKFIPDPDEGGTDNTPLLPARASEDDDDVHLSHDRIKDIVIKHRGSADALNNTAAGSTFGLTEINSLPTFLHWLKGAIVIGLAGGVAFTTLSTILSDLIIIGSLVYLTRNKIFSITKQFFTKK